jgi:monoamine oxidase
MSTFERPRFTRRLFLAGTGAVTLGWLAAACGSSSMTSRSADVVVVGAGLSGLCAARELVAQGVSCVVLEANSHVGGRMVRQPVIEGGWIDLGGQWVGPTQSALLGLAKSLGISHFDFYDKGNTVVYFGGVRSMLNEDLQPSPDSNVTPADLAGTAQLSATMDQLASTVNISKPWLTPNAAILDNVNVASWLSANSTSDFARFFVTTTTAGNGDDVNEVSMLNLLYQNAIGPHSEEPEKWLFNGAAGQIPLMLASKLDDQVVLNQPVYAIEQSSSGVVVRTPSGSYNGKYVIVAVPPYLAGAIDYSPAMPPVRLQLTQRVPMQSIIKCACIYPTAWWREEGLAGQALSQIEPSLTADSSPPSGRPGILTSFLVPPGSVGLEARTAAQRKAENLANLATYFGPKVMNPTQYIEANWPAHKWSGGAYNGFMGPGVLSTFGSALRAPVGRIHWAGTEVATRWAGYFDGAVRAGQDAASAVMHQL